MFVKINKKTQQQTIISSTEMTEILERDFPANRVDAALADMATGDYQHRDRETIYKYQV